MKFSFVLYIAMTIVVAFFAILNVEMVNINFGFIQQDIPLALVILGSVGIGAVIVFIIDFFAKIKNKRAVKEVKKQLEAEKSEKTALNERIQYWETKFKDQERVVEEQKVEIEKLKATQELNSVLYKKASVENEQIIEETKKKETPTVITKDIKQDAKAVEINENESSNNEEDSNQFDVKQ